MITIIFGTTGKGKTSLMSHILNGYAFDRERIRLMQGEIKQLRAAGFTLLTVPPHPVSANYELTLQRFGYRHRKNRFINPYRLGFANKYVETHFTLPYEVIGITEAQKYFNSRMSLYFPDWQSRWFEAHRHNHLDIFMDVQRPDLIDLNIRALAQFIEVVELKQHRVGMTWTVRIFEDINRYEAYKGSNGKDCSCFTESRITADYDVFRLYNSYSCQPRFFDGHLFEDFDYSVAAPFERSVDGFIRYLTLNDDELPQNYYVKRSAKGA